MTGAADYFISRTNDHERCERTCIFRFSMLFVNSGSYALEQTTRPLRRRNPRNTKFLVEDVFYFLH